MKHWARAWRYFRPDIGQIIFAILLLALAAGANLLKPWPLALIFDSVLETKPAPEWLTRWVGIEKEGVLLALTVFLLVLHAAHGGLQAWQNYTSIKVGLRGLARVRAEIFSWLQRLSLGFYQRRDQGDVIYRASWDVFSFQTLFQQGVFTALTATLSLALMVMVMWQVNVRLTWVALGAIPFLAGAMVVFGRPMKQRSLAAHEADSDVTTSIQQTIAALPLIQSFTREAHEEGRFGAKAERALAKRKEQHAGEIRYGLSATLVFAAGTTALAFMGGREVLAGRLTPGELLVFLAYLAQLYEPLNQLSHLGATLSDASAGAQRVFELLDAPEEVKNKPDALRIPSGKRLSGSIRFERVTFEYQPGRPVLKEVSFEASAGCCLALAGPSGAGKTTLLQLVPRFFDPTAGKVLLDGVAVQDYDLGDLRRQISLVLQEPILLAATVAENIRYGRPGATREQIEEAARAAHAHEFIEKLPRQYETQIGDAAARMSVGEKQRLNLARAFLKDAPILILDEPTSALDPESEQLVLDGFRMLMKGRTTLMSAHRFTTLHQADRVLVLDQGRVAGCGLLRDLVEGGGYLGRNYELGIRNYGGAKGRN